MDLKKVILGLVFIYFIFRRPFSEELLHEIESHQKILLEEDKNDQIIDIDDVNRRAKQVSDKLISIGYELTDSSVSSQKTYWQFLYKSNGMVCEFFNIKELEDYGSNF